MRAAILDAPGASLVVYDDVEAEAPHAGEVAVRVSHCGVCHSDLHLVDGEMPPMTPLRARPRGRRRGRGRRARRHPLAVGDHVVLTPCPPCGHCYWCLRGEHSICTNSLALATSVHPDGGTRLSRGGETVYRGLGVAAFAETVITQETGAVKIPDDVPLDVACVIGCAVQTGVGAVHPHRRRAVRRHGARARPRRRRASRSCRAPAWPAPPRSSCRTRCAERREAAARASAPPTHIDPTTEDVVARSHGDHRASASTSPSMPSARPSLVQDGLAATRIGRHHGHGRRARHHRAAA